MKKLAYLFLVLAMSGLVYAQSSPPPATSTPSDDAMSKNSMADNQSETRKIVGITDKSDMGKNEIKPKSVEDNSMPNDESSSMNPDASSTSPRDEDRQLGKARPEDQPMAGTDPYGSSNSGTPRDTQRVPKKFKFDTSTMFS